MAVVSQNLSGTITLVNGEKVLVTGGSGSIVSGIIYDELQASYPNATTEVYQYYLESTLLTTVTVVYTASDKENIQSVVRT